MRTFELCSGRLVVLHLPVWNGLFAWPVFHLWSDFTIISCFGNNGGSFIVLASDTGDGPRSRWQLMMDPYGGTGQWLWTIVASDLDGGSWSWWKLNIDYDCSRTPWYRVFLLRYSTITDNNPSIHWPSVILQNVHPYQCCYNLYLDDVLLYTWHLLHFCPSWERDPSHVHKLLL